MDGPDRRPPAGGGALLGRLALFGFLTAVLTFAAGFVLPAGGVVAGAGVLGFAALVAGWVLARYDGRPPGAVGLVPDRRAVGEGAVGLGLGVAVAAVAMGGMAALGGLAWAPDGTSFALGAWLTEGLRSLTWLAIPAAAEELLLRGYVLGATAAVVGPAWALVATSVTFGVLHGANPGVGPLALAGVTAAGLFLGALVLRTGSVWPAVGAHLGWNWALAFLADVPVSGLEVADAPGFDGAARGPDWLSGGAFGVEASVVAVAVLAGAAALAWRWTAPVPAPGRPAPLWMDDTTTTTTGHGTTT